MEYLIQKFHNRETLSCYKKDHIPKLCVVPTRKKVSYTPILLSKKKSILKSSKERSSSQTMISNPVTARKDGDPRKYQ